MFLAPNFECFTTYDAFGWLSFDYVRLATKAYLLCRGSKL